MFGFNIQNKDEDWDGRLLKDEVLKVENESVGYMFRWKSFCQ